MSYETILTSTDGRVGLITLNRPKALNALNDQLMDELGAALLSFDADNNISCIVITGSEKAFAAGADIGMMSKYNFTDVYKSDYITKNWETIRKVRKPVIAAVAGYALGSNQDLILFYYHEFKIFFWAALGIWLLWFLFKKRKNYFLKNNC